MGKLTGLLVSVLLVWSVSSAAQEISKDTGQVFVPVSDIARQFEEFIAAHLVKSVSLIDRVIGAHTKRERTTQVPRVRSVRSGPIGIAGPVSLLR